MSVQPPNNGLKLNVAALRISQGRGANVNGHAFFVLGARAEHVLGHHRIMLV
jgi:hypothetical protein